MFQNIIEIILNKRTIYEQQLAESSRFINAFNNEYVKNSEGKRIRSIIFYMFSNLKKMNILHHETISLIEVIHNASIIHDDIVDQNNARRGTDSLYHILGLKKSLLLGDHMLLSAVKHFVSLHTNNPFVLKYFFRECQSITTGALKEQCLNDSSVITISDYIRMASLKTGALFKLSCILATYLSGHVYSEIRRSAMWGICFGIIFQVQNDLDSYKCQKFSDSEDYLQKNITFPIIVLLTHFNYTLESFQSNTNQKNFEFIKNAINSETFREIAISIMQKYTNVVESLI